MINGLGVVGWGVGGIEAEAVMVGQPIYMLLPEVVGFKLTGKLPRVYRHRPRAPGDRDASRARCRRQVRRVPRSRARRHAVANRATIANMAPEYGATVGFFPVTSRRLEYLRLSGRERSSSQRSSSTTSCRACGVTRHASITYSAELELDMSTVSPSMAGPKRPQDRIELTAMKTAVARDLEGSSGQTVRRQAWRPVRGIRR